MNIAFAGYAPVTCTENRQSSLKFGMTVYGRSSDSPAGVDSCEIRRAIENPKTGAYFGFVHPATLRRLVEAAPEPYVGEIPDTVLRAYDASPEDLYSALDKLSLAVDKLDLLEQREVAEIEFLGKKVRLQRIGAGKNGIVYAIEQENHPPLVFKVYRRWIKDPYSHGPFPETAAGLYFKRQGPLRDCVDFYASNPTDTPTHNRPWLLAGMITDGMTTETRPGCSVSDLPVQFGDDYPQNRVNGVVVDLGAISIKPIFDLDRFITVVSGEGYTAKTQECYVRHFDELPPKDRLKAYEAITLSRTREVLQWVDAKFYGVPDSEKITAWKMAINNLPPGYLPAVIRMIWVIPEPDRMKAFEFALDKGEPKIYPLLEMQIGSLPANKQKIAQKMLQKAQRQNDGCSSVREWLLRLKAGVGRLFS
ncbi:MAG TPA: hypothetical protein V6C99_07240 [Oculatellaceae cyanobacterium]|jgi:hypothetical protein